MVYVYSAICSFIVGMLSFILQMVMKENRELKKKDQNTYAQEQAALKEGMKCILRDRLIEMHHAFIAAGQVSTHGIQNWLSMYNAYKALGGNGMIDHMKDEIESLPIR